MGKGEIGGERFLYIRRSGVHLRATGILPPKVEQKDRHNEAEAHD